jgi:large subunit ribosomal protein L24
MAVAKKRELRYTKAGVTKKVKPGGRTVVSEALVKKNSTNLIPKLHVKRGDTVMVISGSEKVGRGKTGKVLSAHPTTGKITVEGINLITRATKARTAMGKSGLIKKEGPIFASRVMLFCTACKKPTRIRHKMLDGGKKTRICTHCNEAFDS